VAVEPTEERGDHARVSSQLVSGALDETKFGTAVGAVE
jgi:hypothetical protein